jgi:hypothetical protein
LKGTTPGVTVSKFNCLAIAWISGFFSFSNSTSGGMAGAPIRTNPRRHSWKMLAPRPVMNSPLIRAGIACGSRNSARPSAAFWFKVKSCSSADVLRIFISVGTARLSPTLTSARRAASLALLARDLIGSGRSAALINGSTASVAFMSPSTPAAMVARSKSSSL